MVASGGRHTAGLVLAAFVVTASMTCGTALACMGWDLQQAFLFTREDLARGVHAPIIADVTIVSVSRHMGRGDVLTARVNETIRGKIEGNHITMVMVLTSCHADVRRGLRGIVIGDMTRDAQGNPEFAAISESLGDRARGSPIRLP